MSKKLKAKTMKDIMTHAQEGYPQEICGVVILTEKGTEKYLRCKNIAKDKNSEFEICPDSYADAEELGEVIGIVHSHPDGTTKPSGYDTAVMNRNYEVQLIVDPESAPVPWHIVSWPEGDYRQVIPEVTESLLDRPFVHGVWDCWAACEAYYNRYHGIEFPKYVRKDRWWEEKETHSFYEKEYEAAGFYEVHDLKPGDLIIMQCGRTYHPNHAGVYLGEVSEFEGRKLHGQTLMFHHMYDRKSDVIVYGGQWQQRTRMILRHKEIYNV